MDIKKLEDKMNDYILSMDIHDLFIYENIEYFYSLNFPITKLLDRKFRNYEDKIDISKIDKTSFYENINILNLFYKHLNLNFNVDKLYNDGNILYKFYDYDDVNENDRFKLGCNYYNPGDMHKEILVCNNGLITDAIVLAHELSHYRNQIDGGRNPAARFFT